jgi:rubrerythrin
MKLEQLFKNIESFDENSFATTRREAIRKAGSAGSKAALAALPFALGMLATKGIFAQTSSSITDTLNFALTLEYLESSFYNEALNNHTNLIPSSDKSIFMQIDKHENAHVSVLKATIQNLGGTPISSPNFDFTAGGTYPDVFTNYQTFLVLSQSFEDTGVRAYKGQVGNLVSNDDVLTAALQIHSVEARHASEVRRLRGQKGWIVNADSGGAPQAIYAGEDNTTQGGVNLTSITSVSSQAITAAFDEPLSKDDVLSIAGPFIKS